MISAVTVRFLRRTCLTFIPVMAALSVVSPVNAQTSTPNLPDTPNQAQPLDPSNPNVLRPTPQNNTLLSAAAGQRLMTEASNAVASQNYTLATQKLQEAREVYNQMSNFYQELATSFSGIDNRVADSQRKKALETAQMRDDATYQLALVHRAQNRSELAVPLLVQIIRSQNPTRDLGKKAYQQLFELGFVDTPFPRSGAAPTPPNTSQSNQR
jgi:cell division septum initiation protein DivIVA